MGSICEINYMVHVPMPRERYGLEPMPYQILTRYAKLKMVVEVVSVPFT